MFDLYKGNIFPFPGGIMARIFELKIFRKATKIMVNNYGILNYYKKRYGKDITDKIVVIPNATYPDPYLKLQTPFNPKPPYTILFTGAVYWPQIGSLKNLVKAVNEIDDLDIRLKIYSPSPRDYLKKVGISESNKVSIDVAPPQDMPKIQSQADILFLPLAWNTKSQGIVDTATPAKMTDYLISGRPILVHAPASTYLVEYARENDFGAVVDEENIEALKASIRSILTNKRYADRLVKNAQDTFYRNHHIEKSIRLFRSFIA